MGNTLSLPISHIQPLHKSAHIDKRYGPYPNVSSALTATKATRSLGLTLGILSDQGGVIEYQFKNGITDNDLIIKNTVDVRQEVMMINFKDSHTLTWTPHLSNYYGQYPSIKILKSIDATTWIGIASHTQLSYTYDPTGVSLKEVVIEADTQGVDLTYKLIIQR